MSTKIEDEISSYYTGKLQEFGPNARGVDWNSPEGQEERFNQLTKLIPQGEKAKIVDLGCGYGAYADYLEITRPGSQYLGYDVSESMVEQARKLHKDQTNVRFELGNKINETCDYCVASGIFNVKLEITEASWREWVFDTLRMMNKASIKGMAFNALTSFSDEDRKVDRLHYASPMELMDFCLSNFSRHVVLLHDYGMYEFTVLVKKDR